MQVKVFAGKPENVERAINRWADDGGRRSVNMMLPLPPPSDGDVAVMIVFTPMTAAVEAGKIAVPNGIVH